MRGRVDSQADVFHTFNVEDLIPENHPLRPIDTRDEKVSDGSDDDDSGNPTVNFRGQRRSNQTHRSIIDPEARLAWLAPLM
jgi:hypothetical protein